MRAPGRLTETLDRLEARLMTRRPGLAMRRLLIAAFALWLPAATGQGGRATCSAATSLAKLLTERPHLSCHGGGGENLKKSCCCKGEETIRAAACGCHDGQQAFGTPAHGPLLPSMTWRFGPLHAERSPLARLRLRFDGPPGDAPDDPPPQPRLLRHA